MIYCKLALHPLFLCLHFFRRLMYWTDCGDHALIATADYDGNNRRNIVTSGLNWPNGLALDKKSNTI